MAFPMIHHNFYDKPIEWVKTATQQGVEALGGKCPLYTGVYVPAIPAEDVERMVEYAQSDGAD